MTAKITLKNLLSQRCVYVPLLLLSALSVQAQTAKPCIELHNEAQVEQAYTDAQGHAATRLMPPGKIVPGNEVVYTITAKNICDKPATAVVIDNPVPAHMNYVINSAMGVGTDITYSVDGKTFTKLDALTIKNTDGTARAPRGDEMKSIRWLYTTAINAGQSGFVRFRATVQ